MARRIGMGMGLLCCWMMCGCAELHYSRVRLGQTPEQYDKVLPQESVRRTDAGMCWLERDRFGRTDAIVLLMSRDKRVGGKLRATRIHRDYGMMSETRYELSGEIDPRISGYRETGPLDMIRAVQMDLAEQSGDATAVQALRLVSTGLLRVLQRWPNSGEPVTPVTLGESVELVPGGGEATLRVDRGGLFHIAYRWVSGE